MDEVGRLVGVGDATCVFRGALVAFPDDETLYEVMSRLPDDAADVVRVRSCPFTEW